MRNAMGALAGAALTLALMGACSKPASETATDTSAAASDASANAMAAGGAVSPPAANDAVDAGATASDVAPEAASNSFTEGQAKGHIEKAGYTDVTGLMKGADGIWTAKAMKDGKSMDVSLDFKGAVTAR
ncbi:MAG: hypothetical protein Q8N10_15660 [Phenylobacterium sp.]|uniref:PepSY domain-containing protein n=1 Tax=Phenylobacterium ferrooxidans TaxID=2982689 RepID=A0ABW6CUB8_9CAUL|nr:hypothetical protein [Phenylobacterium sp.]MDO8323346.1 hypothetical protein [Phenylobacterium sp.]MDO8912657.1 hypothetical protein [Phenylobacterium sp.]MDP2009941.1 hypothetical protein [Phenylobacterium sp.]MDP3101923.1 hypothetical protein [Phenylobacterium sp.]MDP3867045.1 hypothetical protein [Phenylobacterium sp.]